MEKTTRGRNKLREDGERYQVRERPGPYKYGSVLNRVQYATQIEKLFEIEPRFIVKTSKTYKGKIDGIDVQVVFRPSEPCRLYAKSPKDLEAATKRARELLIS